MIAILLLAALIAESPLGPCTGDDIAEWHMSEAQKIQALDAEGDMQYAIDKGDTDVANSLWSLKNRLLDESDQYWSEIPSKCQTFLIKKGDE